QAAMRVLGQAWSIAKAPAGTLPSGVRRITQQGVVQKALSVAEAGLRIDLGQPSSDALRDLLFDFYGGENVDPGFDQLLRETDAGRDFAQVVGARLGAPGTDAASYEQDVAEVAASGPDFISFSVDTGAVRRADVSLVDSAGRTSTAPVGTWSPTSAVPTAVIVPIGADATDLLGLVTKPTGSPYVLGLVGRDTGTATVSVTLPAGDDFRRAVVHVGLHPGSRTRVVLDPARPDAVLVQEDANGDGVYEDEDSVPTSRFPAAGPQVLAATVIGPETLTGASPFGVHAAVLFDRVVEAESGNDKTNYAIPGNDVLFARRQLSGRLVFLALAEPEGRYVPQTLQVSGVS